MKIILAIAIGAFVYTHPATAATRAECLREGKDFVSKPLKNGDPGYCRKKRGSADVDEQARDIYVSPAPKVKNEERIRPVIVITDEDGLDDIVSSTAPCKQWVETKRLVKSTGRFGYYRTCPDGDKNNNFGSAKPGQERLPAELRDDDGDGVPNHLDKDDNNNGYTDNVDNGRIVTTDDLGIKLPPAYDRTPRRQDPYENNTIIVVPESVPQHRLDSDSAS